MTSQLPLVLDLSQAKEVYNSVFFQDNGFVHTPYPLHYSNYDDASNEMRTFNKWFTDCKKEYIHKVILGRYLSKWILILMSCLVLEGNMILISGVSGASPTSLLSVNFLFGSWPDKEVTLSRETSAVSLSEPGMNIKRVLLDLCIFRGAVI